MPSVDISQSNQTIESQLEAIKKYVETSKAKSSILSKAGDSFSKANSDVAQQLNKITELQKRFQRNVPTSMDSMLNFLGITGGENKSETYKYLRRKILETASKVEPQIQDIITKNVFKALGCSEEQTYDGVSIDNLLAVPLPLRPQTDGIYVPIQSVDFFGALKKSPNTLYGKFYYEKDKTQSQFFPSYKPYGGKKPFPMNKQLYGLLDSANAGKSFWEVNNEFYNGKSQQSLFDIQYTDFNGTSYGDFYRVILLERVNPDGTPRNTVKDFVQDYYKTIKLVDPVTILASLLNAVVGAASVNTSVVPLKEQSAFGVIVQRILGLCFDSREEIDVSGVSKIAELDGVDESFFELTSVDLRNIDVRISNIQNGVTQFEDCGNVLLPFDDNAIQEELGKLRDELDGLTENKVVDAMEKILDNVVSNPAWQTTIENGVDLNVAFDKDIIKKMALAVAAGVLTPKVLLPIFTMLAVVQKKFNDEYNELVNSLNQTQGSIVSSANTQINEVVANANKSLNIVTGPVDFMKKFRTFNVEVISQISGIFLRELYNQLKKDIINLLRVVIKDLLGSKYAKVYRKINLILQLAAIAFQVAMTINNARKCKNLLNDIKNIISLILIQAGTIPIPPGLQFLSDLLPGYSEERAEINAIELMQSYGLPTGPLPDGSPNEMLLYMSAILKGNGTEMGNMKLEASIPSPVGPIKVFGWPV